MQNLESKIFNLFNETNIKSKMGKRAGIKYKNARKCWLYEQKFKLDDMKDRDHSHLAGKPIEAAHQTCNLTVNKGQASVVPFLCHNFGEYDSHLFIKTLISNSSSYINC